MPGQIKEKDCFALLKKAYKIFRFEYPKETGLELLKDFGYMGQPFEILEEIEDFLNKKNKEIKQ